MNIAQQLEETIRFLQERRKGFRYYIKLSVKSAKWCCTVVGESMEDKSLPHDFVQCESKDFDQLPFLIKNKAAELLAKEVEQNEQRIRDLIKSNDKLQQEYKLLIGLQV